MNVFSKEDYVRLGEAHFSRSTAAAVVTDKMFRSFPSSMGKKFRSQNEVRNYLQDIGSDLEPTRFCFNAYGQASMPRKLKKGDHSRAALIKKNVSHSAKVPRAKVPVAQAIKEARDLSVKTKLKAPADLDDVHQRSKLKYNLARLRLQPASGRQPGESKRPLHSGDLSNISARKPRVSCIAAVAEKFHQT